MGNGEVDRHRIRAGKGRVAGTGSLGKVRRQGEHGGSEVWKSPAVSDGRARRRVWDTKSSEAMSPQKPCKWQTHPVHISALYPQKLPISAKSRDPLHSR